MQLVLTEEPVAPSQLFAKVPRDLETICLKCLHKEPARRYASALDLAEDLRRFRTDEPIQARPVSATERARKWVKRRPTLAALYLVSGLAILALGAGGLWYNARLRAERDRAEANYQRAERNFERARLAVEQMLTEVAEEQLAYEPRMEGKRRVLLEKALAFYQEFLEEKGNDPGVRQATARAAKRVADLARMLRQDRRAEAAYDRAIDLLGALAVEFPDQPALGEDLANSHNFRGEVLRLTDRPQEAQSAYEAALAIQTQLAREFPEEPAYRRDRARTHYNLGILSKDTSRPREAQQHFDEALTILNGLVETFPDNADYRQHLARSYLNLGPVLRVTRGFEQARDAYGRAIALLDALHRQHPDVPDYRHELAVTQNNLAILLASAGRNPDAEQAHQQAFALFTRLAANFPGVPDYRKELANTHNGLGILRARAKDWPEADRHFRRSQELYGNLVTEHADVADYQGHLATALGNRAWLCTEQQDWKGARPLLEDACARLRATVLRWPENRFCRQALRTQYQSLAETLVRSHDHAAAAEAAAAMASVFGDRAQDSYYAACFLARCVPLAENDAKLGGDAERAARARRYADLAVQHLREATAKDCTNLQLLPNEAEVFRPLKGRADYEKVHAELETRTRSATKGSAP
jgi:tetratricopeptide (TPR) repeat protein